MISPPDVKDRAGRIGSSNWEDLLQPFLDSSPSWACCRRLAYDFLGTEPDFPEEVNPNMERGNDLEPVALAKTERVRGVQVAPKPDLDPEPWLPEWWRGEPDGRIARPPELMRRDGYYGPGAWEGKVTGRGRYFGFQENGLPMGWRCQVLYHMPLLGASWGLLTVLCPDPWRMTVVEVKRDEALLKKMLRAGGRFVEQVTSGELPARRDWEDSKSPCATCRYRQTCLGPVRAEAAETARVRIASSKVYIPVVDSAELAAVVARRDRLYAAGARLKAKIDGCWTDQKLICKGLGHEGLVALPSGRVLGLRESVGTAFDRKGLEQRYPEIAAEFTSENVSKRKDWGKAPKGE